MATLQEDYPKIWSSIENQSIPREKIDEFLLNFVKRILSEIKNKNRDDMDIGDAFGIGIQHAAMEGYKINPILEQFLIELGDYKLYLGDDKSPKGSFNSPEEVEAELERVAKKLRISLKN